MHMLPKLKRQYEVAREKVSHFIRTTPDPYTPEEIVSYTKRFDELRQDVIVAKQQWRDVMGV